MSQFQENCWKERWKDRQIEGQTLIHRTLRATTRCPTSNFLSQYISQRSDSTSKASSSFSRKSEIRCLITFRVESSAGPNLNILCIQHSNKSPLLKNCKKFIWSEKLKKHIWSQVPGCSFAFLKL